MKDRKFYPAPAKRFTQDTKYCCCWGAQLFYERRNASLPISNTNTPLIAKGNLPENKVPEEITKIRGWNPVEGSPETRFNPKNFLVSEGNYIEGDAHEIPRQTLTPIG